MADFLQHLKARCKALGAFFRMSGLALFFCCVTAEAFAFSKQSNVGIELDLGHSPSTYSGVQAPLDNLLQLAKGGLTLGEAIAKAKRRHGGEVLSARRAQDANGRTIYVIKILTPRGVVKKVTVR